MVYHRNHQLTTSINNHFYSTCIVTLSPNRLPPPVSAQWCFSVSLCGWGSGSYRHTNNWFTPVTPLEPVPLQPSQLPWLSPTDTKSPGSARFWIRSEDLEFSMKADWFLRILLKKSLFEFFVELYFLQM